MAKKTNKFDATSEGVKAGAPGDEKPTPTVRLKLDGSPRKVREPRVVDERLADLIKTQVAELATFIAGQTASRAIIRAKIHLEARTAKSVARAEKKLLAMNSEEQAWMAKAMAAKLAAPHADPEPEQHP